MVAVLPPRAARKSLQIAECQPYPVTLGTEVFAHCRLTNAVMIRSRLTLKIAMESNTVQPQKGLCGGWRRVVGFQCQIGTPRAVRNGALVAIPLTDPDLGSGRPVL